MAQYVLNFRNADVRAFIDDAARVTGRTFIVDPGVQGKISVVTQRPLSRSEYFELFLSTLRANGFVAVPAAGDALRIQSASTAASSAGRIGSAASPSSFVTEIIRLRTLDAAAAIDAVRPLVSKEGSVTGSRNSIVVADYADNVARIRRVVASIDRNNTVTQILPLQNSGARELAEALNTLAAQSADTNRRSGITIVAIDSSNAITMSGDPATVTRFLQIARDLDRRAASGTEIKVVFLEHADAAQLLPVLQELLGQRAAIVPTGGSSAPSHPSMRTRNDAPNASEAPSQPVVTPSQPGVGAYANQGAIVTRFEGANAIVIAAPADVQRMLGEVIRQLDTRRQQVLVEAIIVEIGNQAAKQLGVQLLLAGTKGSNIPFAVTNYSNGPNILTLGSAIAAEKLRKATTTVNGQVVTTTQNSGLADALQEAAAKELLNVGGGLGGIALRSGNAIFGAIINAVQSDTHSNLLSTPSIMTLDYQEARLLVGQEIPITTGEALSPNFDNTFRTVQRQNVGILLEVTPQINAGGAIKLDLRQEVSSIAGPVSNDSSDLILNKREIRTTITVDDGEIVGIGGLLDDNERRTLEKIPFLGDLPVIGNLFRSKSRSGNKTNLMIFIRPTILRSPEDSRDMTARRYGYIRGRQLAQDPDREPSIDELVRDYMGVTPPGQSPADTRMAPPAPARLPQPEPAGNPSPPESPR